MDVLCAIVRPLRGRKAVHITTAGFQPAVMMKSSLFEALVLSAKAEPLASSARLTALPSSTPWLIPNWRTHTLQGVLLVFVLINDLSLLSYSYFSSQSSGFMTGAKDKKALKKP